MRRRLIFVCAASLFMGLVVVVATTGRAQASDSFNSEFSHAVGGAVMAGAVTIFADDYRPQYRGWIGFATSVGLGVALEGVDLATGSGFSTLDAASNALGAAIGAYFVDRYFLMPVIQPSGKQGAFLGVKGKLAF